ncbi:7SK snRNA methylphosphate capping enzyme isoform X1 [Electrophorus electricus]|uniref:RNA methyltransferase n=2 Tax=Electrophorus electricus TaxID=8005 RepID=A0A4W4FTP8_ELEEL|nr:7SK snRNA methylphosphate capping enzyme isoform X1 [Electrophorus electricus]
MSCQQFVLATNVRSPHASWHGTYSKMIEMSVDKETALSGDKSGELSFPPPPQQLTELSGHCPRDSQRPPETTVTNLVREDEHLPKMADTVCRPASDGVVAAADPALQSQNGVQQPRPQHQQRLNKRRSTMSSGFKHPMFGKRRRRTNSESESVLPTNFLLGGNIFDPLNLNSLLDEEVNRALNAETPKSSPLPAKSRDPVEILIPRDITDPLNLNGCTAGDGGLLLTPLKSSGGRRRHRNRHHGGAGAAGGGAGRGGDGAPTQPDPSESERGKTSSALQTEGAVESSGLHFKLGSVADSQEPKATVEEAVESNSVPVRETKCPSGLSSVPSREEGEESTTTTPVSDTTTLTIPATHAPTAPSHRQRKRRRTTSRSESSGAPCWDKTRPPGSAPGSVRPPQPVHTPATGTQAGSSDRPHQPPNHRRQQRTPSRQKPKQQQQQQQQQQKFQYGNYNKYYGYRNPGLSEDPRVHVLQSEWFQGKAVLDLGCNTGHLTLSIAKSWRPARIVGLDIDGRLIHAARQNIRHYLSEVHTLQARCAGHSDRSRAKGAMVAQGGGGLEAEGGKAGEKAEEEDGMEVEEQRTKAEKGEGESEGMAAQDPETDTPREGDDVPETGWVEGESAAVETTGHPGSEKVGKKGDVASPNGNHVFPVSLRMSRGPIAAPPLPDTHTLPPGDFPANVTFVKGNYVLESDLLLQTQREEFDVVLCLSVTKWVHLNWGDAGLKRLFHRVYHHLRPGGLFILEPQPWSSYSKRKKLTEAIYKNYYSIRFKPEQFSAYLTTEVGFSSYELIGTPKSSNRGFQRPIYLFHKGSAPQK